MRVIMMYRKNQEWEVRNKRQEQREKHRVKSTVAGNRRARSEDNYSDESDESRGRGKSKSVKGKKGAKS